MGKKPILLMALVGVSALAVVGCEKGKVYRCLTLEPWSSEVCATSLEEAKAMCGVGSLLNISAEETDRSCWRRPRRGGTVYKCGSPTKTFYFCTKSLQEAQDNCRKADPQVPLLFLTPSGPRFLEYDICSCTSTGKSC